MRVVREHRARLPPLVVMLHNQAASFTDAARIVGHRPAPDNIEMEEANHGTRPSKSKSREL